MIEAILAIPGALQSLRDLINKPKPDTQAILGQLDLVRGSFVDFSSEGARFVEARGLRQHLQMVSIALGPSDHCYQRAVRGGSFNPRQYSLGSARESWNIAQQQALPSLMEFMAAMGHLDDEHTVRVEIKKGIYRRIPVWGEETLDWMTQIKIAFKAIDQHHSVPPDEIRVVANALRDFSNHIREQMAAADHEFHKRADTISKALETLARDLKHG
jgi:hypothetical protein